LLRKRIKVNKIKNLSDFFIFGFDLFYFLTLGIAVLIASAGYRNRYFPEPGVSKRSSLIWIFSVFTCKPFNFKSPSLVLGKAIDAEVFADQLFHLHPGHPGTCKPHDCKKNEKQF